MLPLDGSSLRPGSAGDGRTVSRARAATPTLQKKQEKAIEFRAVRDNLQFCWQKLAKNAIFS
jgi:hypothetical protein